MIEPYLQRIRQVIEPLTSAQVEFYLEQFLSPERANLRFKLTWPSGAFMEVSEAIEARGNALVWLSYRYHFQDAALRDRFDLLRGYVDTMLLRDVIERHAVSQPLALRWMVRQLLGNAGGAFSVNKFHHDLRAQGVPVGKDTLHAFLAHLEDALLIRTASIATASERRRMVNPRKAYPVDPGLIPVFDRSGKANLGHALETAVALELERRGAELAYLRTATGREVDFLARYPEGHADLVQVCAELDSLTTRERETQALLEAAQEYPQAGLHLIALDAQHRHNLPKGISVHAAPAWFLAP